MAPVQVWNTKQSRACYSIFREVLTPNQSHLRTVQQIVNRWIGRNTARWTQIVDFMEIIEKMGGGKRGR